MGILAGTANSMLPIGVSEVVRMPLRTAGLLGVARYSTAVILCICYWLKMVGIYAAPNAAEVVEVHPFGDRALDRFICDAMRELHSVTAWLTVEADLSISVFIQCRHPDPATALGHHLNVAQKSFDSCRLGVGHRDSFQSRCSRLVAMLTHRAGLFNFTITCLRRCLQWGIVASAPPFSLEAA